MTSPAGVSRGASAFCATNRNFFCCRAFPFFFPQTAHIFGSLIQTIDNLMAHMMRNLDKNSLPLTIEGMSSVAGRIWQECSLEWLDVLCRSPSFASEGGNQNG